MPRFAARLHVLLARDQPLGLILRRGPSNSVATLLWNRKTDRFQLGQWLKGRIYERRCDLSSDGKHFLYFAMNGRWHTESRGSWTAISRAPFLKALTFLPKGDGWHGGGLWTGVTRYWLNDGAGHQVLRSTSRLHRDLHWQPAADYGGECPGVYYPRLIRDGWTLKEAIPVSRNSEHVLFEKPCPHGWVLRKIAHAESGAPPGKGCYWDEHVLCHPATAVAIAYPAWEWADLDGSRLVWAAHGQLATGRLTKQGLSETRTLIDLNDLRFEAIKAPY